MDKSQHWENVHLTKCSTEVSWFEHDPKKSLDLILEASGERRGRVIDIGGGQSFLVEKLLDTGFAHVAVLDISSAAIAATKGRLGDRAAHVQWIVNDITAVDSLGEFDIWHDRAVLHFLTAPDDRHQYFKLLKKTLPRGGVFIIGAFAIGGPASCSGLPIRQYDAAMLATELGGEFELEQAEDYLHKTPSGNTQRFFLGSFRRTTLV